MRYLSFGIDNFGDIPAPKGVPIGGLYGTGIFLIRNALQIILILGIVVALFFIIYAGIQWIMSEGDKQKLQFARNRLVFSIIGLLVILLSFFIVNLIGGLFGVNLTSLPI